MRKVLAVLAGSALAAVMATTAAASPFGRQDPVPDPRNICPGMVSMGYHQTYGDCTSGYRMGDAGFCMRMGRSMLELMGFRSQGECVARMRELERR